MARKKSENRKLWEKLITNFKRRLKYDEKRGYRYDKSAIPSAPARVTKKALRELEELAKPANRRQQAVVKPVAPRREKPYITGAPNNLYRLNQLVDELTSFQPWDDVNKYAIQLQGNYVTSLADILIERMNTEDVVEVAESIDNNIERIHELLQGRFRSSKSDEIVLAYQEMRLLIMGRPMSLTETMNTGIYTDVFDMNDELEDF